MAETAKEDMKVWVVEPTDYDCYGIYGVFATLEAAKAYTKDEWHENPDGSWDTTWLHLYQEVVQGA